MACWRVNSAQGASALRHGPPPCRAGSVRLRASRPAADDVAVVRALLCGASAVPAVTRAGAENRGKRRTEANSPPRGPRLWTGRFSVGVLWFAAWHTIIRPSHSQVTACVGVRLTLPPGVSPTGGHAFWGGVSTTAQAPARLWCTPSWGGRIGGTARRHSPWGPVRPGHGVPGTGGLCPSALGAAVRPVRWRAHEPRLRYGVMGCARVSGDRYSGLPGLLHGQARLRGIATGSRTTERCGTAMLPSGLAATGDPARRELLHDLSVGNTWPHVGTRPGWVNAGIALGVALAVRWWGHDADRGNRERAG